MLFQLQLVGWVEMVEAMAFYLHFLEACHRYVIQKAKENERLSLSDDRMMR